MLLNKSEQLSSSSHTFFMMQRSKKKEGSQRPEKNMSDDMNSYVKGRLQKPFPFTNVIMDCLALFHTFSSLYLSSFTDSWLGRFAWLKGFESMNYLSLDSGTGLVNDLLNAKCWINTNTLFLELKDIWDTSQRDNTARRRGLFNTIVHSPFIP